MRTQRNVEKTLAAVVTGGGSGIGTMIATAYVQNGAKVYIASRKEEQLKTVRSATFISDTVYAFQAPQYRCQKS